MAANNNIQISDLDFDSIKNNLKTFLRGQNTFKDYDFEGSGLSVLLDVLAYNTHYNAYYLNMVGNEMFLDTAALRSSVVSHAKLLNYTPTSAIAPVSTINLTVTGVTSPSLTLPKFTSFKSEAVDGVNYTFVTNDIKTVSVVAGTATFPNVSIYQGQPVSLSYTVDTSTNLSQTFSLPDVQIDTTTIIVQVQQSITNGTLSTYTLADNVLQLNDTSQVFFLQEGSLGLYEIYFGDGILGQSLIDGNIVNVSYLVTSGTASTGANNFVLLDSIGGTGIVNSLTSASMGGDQESISSIKYQAPKSYAAQGRAVTFEDYITAIQQNKLNFGIDSVSVWGGEDNVPPIYGQVFISIKPAGQYALTDNQKNQLIVDVIKPLSVITVQPTILDPDYTYVKLNVSVVYDQKKTTLTSSQISDSITTALQSYSASQLNTFNSTFSLGDVYSVIQQVNPSIISSSCKVQVQKKIYPTLDVSKQYILNYGVPLNRGVYSSGVNSTPTIQYYKNDIVVTLLNDVYIEEIPFPSSGVQSVSILNPGFNYSSIPVITITGDGTGATAVATVVNGQVTSITVTNPGINYTQAFLTITNASGDTTGSSCSAYLTLQGQYGSLRSYYYDGNNIKTVLNPNIGVIDYYNGIVTLNNFNPTNVNNSLGQLTITANPESTIISSSRNRIVTIDPYDPTSITVSVTAK